MRIKDKGIGWKEGYRGQGSGKQPLEVSATRKEARASARAGFRPMELAWRGIQLRRCGFL